ncbi:alpha/beta hydrolase [Aquabacterium sp. A7-Y]|uniref:alpha/beta hydrolase n=1 Tax=Aquabacterium sp. A7-Y TaxID=1349605 RepID=UPI00223CDD58|nr:alpha/beta hydrolase family protein [Aquabacterium sp. A7-Y]MCW7539116.1 alpha/beta hydrolase [Aquabacterium sp. A7-Y]
MADYVLVHGAWHGAWCWKRILPGLWQAGHRAFAVTLTGVGERAHLLQTPITLQTHVEDVCRVIEAEELDSAVLVGHSYAGMVVTGVADRLPEHIGQLVYLDAVVPGPGESWSSGHSPETREQRRAQIAAQGVLPPADPVAFGLRGEDAAWVARRMTPQPGGVYDSPLDFDAARVFGRPKTFIDCTDPALPTIAASRRRVRSESGWQVVEIATGHDPMISAPEALLRALLALA